MTFRFVSPSMKCNQMPFGLFSAITTFQTLIGIGFGKLQYKSVKSILVTLLSLQPFRSEDNSPGIVSVPE